MVSSAGQSHGVVCSLSLVSSGGFGFTGMDLRDRAGFICGQGKIKKAKTWMSCVQNVVHRWNLGNTPDFCPFFFFLQLKRQNEGVLALILLAQVLHPWRASNRAGAVALECWCHWI